MRAVMVLVSGVLAAGCSTPMTRSGQGGTSGLGGASGAGGGGISTETPPPPFASLSVQPTALNLGSADIGSTSLPGALTVTNLGNATSGEISVVATAGVTASGCTVPLRAGASCTIAVSATPLSAGPFTGSVFISADPGTVNPLVVSVSATAVGGSLAVWPTYIDLGYIPLGAAVPPQVVTIWCSATITGLSTSARGPDVSLDRAATTCTATLGANEQCVVVVNFAATVAGARGGNAVVISQGGMTKTVPVTAYVQAPARLVISPSDEQQFVAAPGQASVVFTFTVTNTGDLQSGALSPNLTGDGAVDFEMQSDCVVLRALGTCTVSVMFKPPLGGSTETRTARLTVAESDPVGSSASVDLAGIVRGPAAILALHPDTSMLGSVALGALGPTTSFTLVNEGDGASGTLTVSVSSTELRITKDTCTGLSLAAGEFCYLGVALQPSGFGARTGTLTVAGSGGASAVRTLTGTGIEGGGFYPSPSTIDFGGVPVDTTSSPRTVILGNVGGTSTGPLTLRIDGSSAFSITESTCTGPLAPGARCSFAVTFTPRGTAAEVGMVTITDGSISGGVAMEGHGTF